MRDVDLAAHLHAGARPPVRGTADHAALLVADFELVLTHGLGVLPQPDLAAHHHLALPALVADRDADGPALAEPDQSGGERVAAQLVVQVGLQRGGS